MSSHESTAVAVTGMGAVTPIGNDVKQFWEASVAGRSGIREIQRFDTSRFACKIGGQVSDLQSSPYYKKNWKSLDLSVSMALTAASEALDQAQASAQDENSLRYGIFLGTGTGSITTHEASVCKVIAGERLHPLSILRAMPNAALLEMVSHCGFGGPSATFAAACTSSSHAIGEAFKAIQAGRADLMIAGGTDAPLSQPLYTAWSAMRVMSSWAGDPAGGSRPFSNDRSGLVLGEGAAFLVLETVEHARKRGVEPLGYILGYASNTTFEHPTRPSVEPERIVMRMAMEDAAIDPSEVDYIYAHGTGTKANDGTETQAIKAAFGDSLAYTIPVSSPKSMYGHTLGACGAFGCVTTFLGLRHKIAVPTMNLHEPDPECDLNYVPNEAQTLKQGRHALVNAFGFGGSNATLVLGL
jgi:3-oxoacyl-[acyl-carrier-protein] synthase II